MGSVILVGYMGCGKSTIGRRLSFRLKKAFLDTDKQIELKQQCTINEIFDNHGEQYFRNLETEYLKEILENKSEYVIAVGGGLPLREENRKLLKKIGKVVYLKAEPETIYKRLKNDTTRPLLKGDNPREKIQNMIETRHPVYMDCADEVIEVDDKKFSQILREIQGRGIR